MVSDVREYNKDAFLKILSRSNNRNPIKTQPVLQVSSWSLGRNGHSWQLFWWCQILKSIIKMLSWKFHQDSSTETPSWLSLSSKSLLGVWEDMDIPDTFLMVSDVKEYNEDALLKISSRSISRNPIMTEPVLQVSSWSLGGHGGSWQLFRWRQMVESIIKMLSWKFYQDPTTETPSRLSLSSKSLLESGRT